MSEITPEMQAAIDAAVEAATAKLKTKNAELIGEVRDLKTAKTAAEEAAEAANEEAQRKAGDITALEGTLTNKHAKALKAAEDARDAALTQLNTLLVDNGIQRALVENNVAPHFHEPLTAMFKAQAKLADGKAMLGDLDLSEGIKAYSESDAGKHYVAASVNSGGNAVGSKTPGLSHNYTKETLTLTEFSKLAREDVDSANAIAASVGATFKA